MKTVAWVFDNASVIQLLSPTLEASLSENIVNQWYETGSKTANGLEGPAEGRPRGEENSDGMSIREYECDKSHNGDESELGPIPWPTDRTSWVGDVPRRERLVQDSDLAGLLPQFWGLRIRCSRGSRG